jgi:hypothetical protein
LVIALAGVANDTTSRSAVAMMASLLRIFFPP